MLRISSTTILIAECIGWGDRSLCVATSRLGSILSLTLICIWPRIPLNHSVLGQEQSIFWRTPSTFVKLQSSTPSGFSRVVFEGCSNIENRSKLCITEQLKTMWIVKIPVTDEVVSAALFVISPPSHGHIKASSLTVSLMGNSVFEKWNPWSRNLGINKKKIKDINQREIG